MQPLRAFASFQINYAACAVNCTIAARPTLDWSGLNALISQHQRNFNAISLFTPQTYQMRMEPQNQRKHGMIRSSYWELMAFRINCDIHSCDFWPTIVWITRRTSDSDEIVFVCFQLSLLNPLKNISMSHMQLWCAAYLTRIHLASDFVLAE